MSAKEMVNVDLPKHASNSSAKTHAHHPHVVNMLVVMYVMLLL